jgi:hypothetical protein
MGPRFRRDDERVITFSAAFQTSVFPRDLMEGLSAAFV